MDGTGIYYYNDGLVTRIDFVMGKKIREDPISAGYMTKE